MIDEQIKQKAKEYASVYPEAVCQRSNAEDHFIKGAEWMAQLKSSPVSVDINQELVDALKAYVGFDGFSFAPPAKYKRGIELKEKAKAALSKASSPKQSGE